MYAIKRIICLLLMSAGVAFGLTACGESTPPVTEGNVIERRMLAETKQECKTKTPAPYVTTKKSTTKKKVGTRTTTATTTVTATVKPKPTKSCRTVPDDPEPQFKVEKDGKTGWVYLINEDDYETVENGTYYKGTHTEQND